MDTNEVTQYEEINIRDLANRFNPSLAKRIPGFAYRIVEKILHLQWVNDGLRGHQDDNADEFLDYLLDDYLKIKVNYKGNGFDQIRKMEGTNLMVASNHPYGGPEAIATIRDLRKVFPDIRLVAQSFLQFIKPMQGCCVYNKKNVRTLMSHLESRKPLLIYPAGFCSRPLSFKEVFDYEWKPSFIKMAKKNNMPIVVMFVEGSLSKRTLRFSAIGNLFKVQLGTLFLVDELKRMCDTTINITVGDVICPETFDDSISNSEWAARLRQYCHKLKTDPNARFDPSEAATLPLR